MDEAKESTESTTAPAADSTTAPATAPAPTAQPEPQPKPSPQEAPAEPELSALKKDLDEIRGMLREKESIQEKEDLLEKDRRKPLEFTPEKTSLGKHWLRDILCHFVKRLFRAQWFRMFLWLVLASFSTSALLLSLKMYSECGRSQAEIGRLEIVETKYRTLKSWAERDKVWRLRFLIVDRCYSDTVFYRDDISAIQSHIKEINNQDR